MKKMIVLVFIIKEKKSLEAIRKSYLTATKKSSPYKKMAWKNHVSPMQIINFMNYDVIIIDPKVYEAQGWSYGNLHMVESLKNHQFGDFSIYFVVFLRQFAGISKSN